MSNEANFTKGEWKIFNERVGVVDNSDTQSFGMMMEVAYIDMYNFGEDQGKANSNLIAAAPEMYEMLEMLISMPTYDAKHFLESDDSILKLLAKARGE